MDNSAYVALSLSSVTRRSMEVVANNLANSNTAGFKGERAMFEEYLHKQPEGEDVSFVLDKGSYLDTSQGMLQHTGNPLNVAIEGNGWMAYQDNNGVTMFGRDGRMTLDSQGNLVTLQGKQVLDAGGAPIALPPEAGSDITISKDGMISDAQGNNLAQLGVFDVPDIQGYQRIGGGMFTVPEELGQPNLVPEMNTKLVQGFVEGSNVQPIVELTRMMSIQKSYERASKLSEGHNELRKNVISRLGRPA
ncbi:flagellar basal-body rod protein FlgF [Sulfitobacter sp. R18_1]|uniref:flagellar basal-body rod protein FlgF n=1 Tax=Sulfitobacter sp. R18_1 TaxID=2821104 RepID=UPI001ADA393F|nr:flagellar basal-body rod protein FlgF [Sulfitobacter sp. R18_1]MBO9428644.1 flagellar basal-body rod protein FlgF [Sulfitobacter sp. R18_1]